MKSAFRLTLLSALPLALAACMRGGISTDPPVHLVLDMDFQPKLRAQGATEFAGWPDGRARRWERDWHFGRRYSMSGTGWGAVVGPRTTGLPSTQSSWSSQTKRRLPLVPAEVISQA